MANENYPPGWNPDNTTMYRLPAPEELWRDWSATIPSGTPKYERLNTLLEADADDRPPQVPAELWQDWLETLTAAHDPAVELQRLVEQDIERASADVDGDDVNLKVVMVMSRRIAHRAREVKSHVADADVDDERREQMTDHLDNILDHADILQG